MLVLARVAFGAVLIISASLKLVRPRATSDALVTFGVQRRAFRWALWVGGTAVELGLGAAVVVGPTDAAYVAAALLLVFVALLSKALREGRAGEPCGCFGARSRVRRLAVVRNLVLAGCLAVLPQVPASWPSGDTLLAVGLALALAGIAGLGLAVLALARQVGELKLAIGAQPALDLAGEGPEIGSRSAVITRFDLRPGARFALAVFVSESCPVCVSVAPAVELLDRDRLVSLERFDELLDQEVWLALSVPGAPYAVALALDGTVLAKGTFNNLPQLESVLGSAERRTQEAAGV